MRLLRPLHTGLSPSFLTVYENSFPFPTITLDVVPHHEIGAILKFFQPTSFPGFSPTRPSRRENLGTRPRRRHSKPIG